MHSYKETEWINTALKTGALAKASVCFKQRYCQAFGLLLIQRLAEKGLVVLTSQKVIN